MKAIEAATISFTTATSSFVLGVYISKYSWGIRVPARVILSPHRLVITSLQSVGLRVRCSECSPLPIPVWTCTISLFIFLAILCSKSKLSESNRASPDFSNMDVFTTTWAECSRTNCSIALASSYSMLEVRTLVDKSRLPHAYHNQRTGMTAYFWVSSQPSNLKLSSTDQVWIGIYSRLLE